MINYEINEDAKTVKCIIHGDELKNSVHKMFNKKLRSMGINFLYISNEKFLLKDTYTGIAKFSPEETKEFSIELGKEIARKKAFAKYNKDMHKNIKKLKSYISDINEELLMSCFEYEFIEKDINEAVRNY